MCRRENLDEFVKLYNPANRHAREATWSTETPDGRWRGYGYADLIARDKASLDIFWLKDDSLADSDNQPPPGCGGWCESRGARSARSAAAGF